MQHTTYNVQQTAYGMQHATYGMQRTIYNIQHATYGIRHATYSVQHATCGIQHTAYGVMLTHGCLCPATPLTVHGRTLNQAAARRVQSERYCEYSHRVLCVLTSGPLPVGFSPSTVQRRNAPVSRERVRKRVRWRDSPTPMQQRKRATCRAVWRVARPHRGRSGYRR